MTANKGKADVIAIEELASKELWSETGILGVRRCNVCGKRRWKRR